MLKAIIFDMDGVLVNSPKYIWESFNALLKKFGVHISKEEVKKNLGISLRDRIPLWKKKYSIKEDIDIQDFSKKSFEIQLELMKKQLKPNKPVNKLIQSAKQEGIKIAVATSSTFVRAKNILELIEIWDKLDAIVTTEDAEKHKPDPELFLKTAEKLKIAPEDCVVIEDAVNGIEAAKRAGMKVIGLTTEFYSIEELKDANLVINNLSELTLEKLKTLF